jgi:hypothetical protein
MKRALRLGIFASVFAGVVCCCGAQAPNSGTVPTAQEIMARVASNQDQAEAERAHYVYVQHAKMASRKGQTVLCEERTDYRITPSSDGSHDELLKLDGRLRVKGKYVSYNALKAEDKPDDKKADAKDGSTSGAKADAKDGAKSNLRSDPKPDAEENDDALSVTIGDDGMDRDLVENMRKELMHDKSKDGINAHLFPLTSKEQEQYAFALAGQERLNGREVYHITFRPKDKDDWAWKGVAYIDAAAYQPVMVTTELSRKVPFAVRTLLGTNVPGLGFTVIYAPQADGVWFPVSFSSEFKIHVLYFFHRDIVMDAQNRDFEKTHVTSTILDGMTEIPPPQP